MTNVYESTFNKNKIGENKNAYAEVFDIVVDHTKLIDHIHFSNPIVNSSVAILAVTGITADIEAPTEEASVTSDISTTSFRAAWDAVDGAASYRLDVAEDEDFQQMVGEYNNMEVNTTSETIEGLESDGDYYWRVRAVNSDGGQSASSAPRRVRTQAPGGPQATDEESGSIAAEIADLLNSTTNIIINRTLYKDGCFNTLCLPFSLDATGIAASPLAGCQLYSFDHADVIGDARLDVYMNETNAIEAGVPYLIKWANTNQVINNLHFNSVTITTDHGQSVGEGVQFVGNIATAALAEGDHNSLFVGGNNTLYWPNTAQGLKGFRAYFSIPSIGEVAVRRGTPARIVLQQSVPTAIDIPTSNKQCTKTLRNGQLVIIRDGKEYNVQGQMIK